MDFMIKMIQKLQYAISGIWITLREEKTILLQFIYLILVIVVGAVLKISTTDWAILIICLVSNIVFEMINSAIENFLDLITFNYDLRIKKIKDIFAGASLTFSIAVFVVTCLIIIPNLIKFINNN